MLPLSTLPILERWDCHQCGFCCRGSIIPLSEKDLAKLAQQKWNERPEFRHLTITVPLAGRSEKRQLAKQADGSCIFLQENGLCRIHAQFGLDAKPLTCRLFPLQIIPREKDAILTTRRACPSAAADSGRSLAEHLPLVRSDLQESELLETGVPAPAIKPGETPDWKRARVVLETLRRLTADERYPPIRRLVHGLEFCRLLDEADLASLDARKLSDLAQVLEVHIADEAATHFTERVAPGLSAKIMFRQMALEVVRIHPRSQPTATWKERLKLPFWAIKMVRGKGSLPRINDHFAAVDFATLEEPLARLTPESVAALGRFFEATTASYQYALAGKPGWTILESYRELALLYPLGLWILRWATAGRVATPEDVFETLCMLDRAQGYAPLAGPRQRRRLRNLTQLGQLPTLVAWYGR